MSERRWTIRWDGRGRARGGTGAAARRPLNGGFTLIEMIVVIGIIALASALAFPMLNKLSELSRGVGGINSVSIAVNAANIYNHRLKENDRGSTTTPWGGAATYSGTAALFTPDGRVRLVINDQLAQQSNGDYLEDKAVHDPRLNGYTDIEGIDYVVMPASAGVVGVVRRGTGINSLVYVPPPFAIRFNENGQVATDEAFIYYDGNYNGRYAINDGPGGSNRVTFPSNSYSSYDPSIYDPRVNYDEAQTNFDPVAKRYYVPFEKVPVVNALLLYDATKFQGVLRGAGNNWGASTVTNWLQEHGQSVYLSPMTGLVMGGK